MPTPFNFAEVKVMFLEDLKYAIEKQFKIKVPVVNFDKTNNEHLQILLDSQNILGVYDDYSCYYVIHKKFAMIIDKNDYLESKAVESIIDDLCDMFFVIDVDAFIDEFKIYDIGNKKYKSIFNTRHLEREDSYDFIKEEIDAFNEDLASLYEDDELLYVYGTNLTWRGLSGYKIITDMDKILYELLPDYDATVIFYQNIEDRRDIIVYEYSHDVPTGSQYVLTPIPDVIEIMAELAYEYEFGDKINSTLNDFIIDISSRLNIVIDNEDIDEYLDKNAYSIFNGEIDVAMEDNIVKSITYDEEKLIQRVVNNIE